MIKLVLILSLCIAGLALRQDIPPQNPIIGIYTQTYNSTTSYIAASYVKFIQMAGAQVVPIYSFSETSEVLKLLKKINGVLFTGGQMDYDINAIWTKNADAIFKYAKDQFDQGNPFPIFGTCMGFQLLAYLSANYDDSVLSRVHGDISIIHPLTFVNQGYIFNTLNPTQREKISKGQGLMYYSHNWAVTVDTFNQNQYLRNFWIHIATSTTPQSERFVAAFEAKRYPFYGVQFHPEKSPFEWKIYADRSLEAIEITQIFSNRFVDIARQNKNRFSSALEFTQASIYNFNTYPTHMNFTQVYIFKETPRTTASEI